MLDWGQYSNTCAKRTLTVIYSVPEGMVVWGTSGDSAIAREPTNPSTRQDRIRTWVRMNTNLVLVKCIRLAADRIPLAIEVIDRAAKEDVKYRSQQICKALGRTHEATENTTVRRTD